MTSPNMNCPSAGVLKLVQDVLHRYSETKLCSRADNLTEITNDDFQEKGTNDKRERSSDDGDGDDYHTIELSTKKQRTPASFSLGFPNGFSPCVMYNKAEFAFWKILIHDASQKPWPHFTHGLWNEASIVNLKEPEWGFCICFGDDEVDRKLGIQKSYCIGLRHRKDSKFVFKFMWAGSLDNLREETRSYIMQRRFKGIHIRKKKATDVIQTASFDLRAYHT